MSSIFKTAKDRDSYSRSSFFAVSKPQVKYKKPDEDEENAAAPAPAV